MNSLFIGECPEYCNDRGSCTVSGCQCSMGYSGTDKKILICVSFLKLCFEYQEHIVRNILVLNLYQHGLTKHLMIHLLVVLVDRIQIIGFD